MEWGIQSGSLWEYTRQHQRLVLHDKVVMQEKRNRIRPTVIIKYVRKLANTIIEETKHVGSWYMKKIIITTIVYSEFSDAITNHKTTKLIPYGWYKAIERSDKIFSNYH